MVDSKKLVYDLVHLSRLALTGTRQDVELFIRRLNRKLDKFDINAAKELSQILESVPKRGFALKSSELSGIPVDSESRLGLLRVSSSMEEVAEPFLSPELSEEVSSIIMEQMQVEKLLKAGVEPSKAVLFVGPPGVGKTHTANFIANKLSLPLLTLDLSTVMSSFLGKTGNNIRNIFDYAKSCQCVLFLDELDAIAKKRDDVGEMGELKRLVTVLLQEIDSWPSGSLLIAATNHQDLLDPAIWRRFDRILKFSNPSVETTVALIKSDFGEDIKNKKIVELLATVLSNFSQAEVIREVNKIKRRAVLTNLCLDDAIQDYIEATVESLPHGSRMEIAEGLAKHGFASQRKASAITGVSRDTIRKKMNN